LAKEEQSALSMFQMPVFLIDTYYTTGLTRPTKVYHALCVHDVVNLYKELCYNTF